MPREILPRPVSERDVSILIASGKQSHIMATMERITLWFPSGFLAPCVSFGCFSGRADGLCFSMTSHFSYKWGRGLCHCVYINNSSSNTWLFKWLLLYVFWKLTNLQCLVDKQLRTKSGNSPLPNLCTFLVVLKKRKRGKHQQFLYWESSLDIQPIFRKMLLCRNKQ